MSRHQMPHSCSNGKYCGLSLRAKQWFQRRLFELPKPGGSVLPELRGKDVMLAALKEPSLENCRSHSFRKEVRPADLELGEGTLAELL